MIAELEILAILQATTESRGRLGEEEMRAAALLASLYAGQLIRHDYLLDTAAGLQKKELLRRTGDEWELTGKGEALLAAIGEKQIGASRIRSLNELAVSLRNSPSSIAYIRSVGPKVTEMVRSQKSKFSQVAGEVVLCALLTRIQNLPRLAESVYEAPAQWLGQEKEVWPVLKRTESDLSNQSGHVCRLVLDSTRGIVLTAPVSPEALSVKDVALKRISTRELESKSAGSYLVSVVEAFLFSKLLESGYSPVGGHRRVFMRYGGGKDQDSHAGVPAVRTHLQPFPPNSVLIWIEEFSKQMTRALDVIGDARTDDEIRTRLSGCVLRTLPYESSAELMAAIPGIDLATELVPGTDLSFVQYWSGLGYEVEEQVQPLLLLRTKTGQYKYPAEMVLIRSPAGGLPKDREPTVMTPMERMSGLERLAVEIFGKSKMLRWQSVDFVLDSIAPSTLTLPEEWRPRTFFVNPPLLHFGGGEISADPRDVFNFGPEAGKKNMVISHIYYPAGTDSLRCRKAIECICRHYSDRGFGEARVDANAQLIGYRSAPGSAEVADLIRRTRSSVPKEAVGIAFLEDDELYHVFKRQFQEHHERPIQALYMDTMGQVLDQRRGVLDQLALNLYLKRLAQMEAPWTLVGSAGGSDRTSFAGIAFSRALDPKRAGKGVAVLHDARGRGLKWDMLMTPGERTITQDWFGIVLDQLLPLLGDEPADRLVIYRPGMLFPVEEEAIGRALSKKLDSATKLEFVEVLSEHRRFFVRNGGVLGNPMPGTVILWSDEDALLCESGFAERGIDRGTVVPVGLRRIIGMTPLGTICAEYHDQTHLSWSAPSTTWKHPLVIKIAERMAIAAREGVPPNAVKFLPL
jgi:hypothetical protein